MVGRADRKKVLTAAGRWCGGRLRRCLLLRHLLRLRLWRLLLLLLAAVVLSKEGREDGKDSKKGGTAGSKALAAAAVVVVCCVCTRKKEGREGGVKRSERTE